MVTPRARPSGPGGASRPDRVPPRPVIERIRPLVDGGRFAAKRVIGDTVAVECDAFCDGHDRLSCELRVRHDDDPGWTSVEMSTLGNDRFTASFVAGRLGLWQFVIRAGIDHFGTWLHDLWAWAEGGQDVSVELAVGADLLVRAAGRAKGPDRRTLEEAGAALKAARSLDDGLRGLVDLDHGGTVGGLLKVPALVALAGRYRDQATVSASGACPVMVEPERARFSTWYELFARSTSPVPGRAGTLGDVRARLDYVEHIGADVLYLPPIHPIGVSGRKGRNGSTTASPGDPGSPWAIGSAEGGHRAIHPDLGTLADFDALVADARRRNIAVAMDLALQCSPDHPWVREHPEWFRRRPDGTIRYAENPPKRYEDIYPFDFDTEHWWELWQAILEVVRHWIGHGVEVFRVDNPHTKPFAFWEWLIATVKSEHPEVIFLSEAFTRPAAMYRLAKLGFSQSYTYFAWRTSKWDLETYLAELAEVSEFFRPNFWPNTPDILTEQLQTGGTAAFVSRLVLAATLTASYGVYGPAFELQEHVARSPGSEEYAGSEKYEVRFWDLDRPDSLAPLLARLNDVRRRHPALQRNDTLRFHHTDNDQLIAYSKHHGDDTVLVVVNLDPSNRQSGWVDLWPLSHDAVALSAHDLLTDARYRWEGQRCYVILDPDVVPAHVVSVTPEADEVEER